MRPLLAAPLLVAAACAAVGGDPWRRATEVFRDRDVVACIDAKRTNDGLDLRWVGARAEGDSRLLAVRMIVFCDANGDLVPQPDEQLTRWNATSEQPIDGFSAEASFRATNLKADVLDALCVFTEVTVEGRAEPLQQARRLP